MRLLITTDSVGGVWTYALDLARGLTAYGWQITLAVMGPAPRAEQECAARAIPGLELIVMRLPLDWTATSALEVRDAGRRIAALAQERNVDLVHLTAPAFAASGEFSMPVIGACHSCIATWWQAVKNGPLPKDFVWRVQLLRDGYANCERLVAPTLAFARTTAQMYGIPTPHVIHNGRRFPPLLQQGRDITRIFSAGRLWDKGKGYLLLDAAAARMRTPVRVAGPLQGPDGETIEFSALEHLGLLDESQVREWCARAGIFVSAALYEPFGLSILEAAQAGCALVLSDIPTLRELWDGAALFLPANDSVALAYHLDQLAIDPLRRAQLAAAAQRRARRYSVAAMTAATEQLYRRTLKSALPDDPTTGVLHEDRLFHPFSAFLLESRQRPLSARRAARADRERP